MSRVIAQVALQRDSGLARDEIVNTMHFEDDSGFSTDGGIDANGPGLMTRLATFYQESSSSLSSVLTGQGTITLYDWTAPTPRVPRLQSTFTFVPQTTALPSEVALCISFRGEKVAGANAARRRGRIYFGPLASSASINPTPTNPASDVRPVDDLVKVILGNFRTMALGGSGAFRLAVFSPTTWALGTGSADDAWNDVTHIWADNAFDTVRSRGAEATKRFQASIGGTDPFVLVA